MLEINRAAGNILVRGVNWVGDAIMTLPAVTAWADNFPRGRITVLAKPWVAPIYQAHPRVAEVMVYEAAGRHRGARGRLRLIKELRARKFELALVLPNSFEAALLAFGAAIPQRLGWAGDGRAWLLSSAPKPAPEDKQVHQARYYLNLLQRYGLRADYSRPVLKPGAGAEKRARALLAAWGAAPQGPGREFWLGLAPGAAFGPAKRWPAAYFARAAELILQKRPGRVFIFGSAGEADSATAVARDLGARAVNLAGQTDLLTAAAIMARCQVLLTNDSGLMHLAGALDTPLVAMFGPTNPQTTSPAGGCFTLLKTRAACAPCLKRVCPLPRQICFDDLPPEATARAALQLVESRPGPNGKEWA